MKNWANWVKHIFVGWNLDRGLMVAAGAVAVAVSESAAAPSWVKVLCAALLGGGLLPTPGHAPASGAPQDVGAKIPPS